MSRSDGLLIALNAFMLLWAFIGLASSDEETLIVGAMLAMAVAVVNGVTIYRRRKREPKDTRRATRGRTSVDDEMDARTVLDLDARLEALELAQADAADAAQWRALVASGQVTGPAAEMGDGTQTPDLSPTVDSARSR